MANAIMIAALAGLASAMLAAAAVSGPGVGLFFAIIAPLPLMIVAIRWQPLLAVLGGALMAAALAFFLRGSAAISFSVLVTLPAFIVGSILWRGHFENRAMVGILCLSAAGYAVLATLVGAFSISFDYAELEQHLLRQSEQVYRFMMGIGRDAPLTAPGGQDPQMFIQAYANAVAPLSCAMLAIIYMFNIWLAAKIAHRSNPAAFNWTPAYSMQFPRLMLPVSAVALLGGMLPGYPGLIMELIGTAAVVCLTVLGYAAVHHALVGKSFRTPVLAILWIMTIVFAFPVLVMLAAGIAELALGWRERIVANRKT
ncbi:MAG: DUF2232 domain-containing protein [Methylocystis sp.]|nr:DUF2232 domain-containing protein [Methylocystis sp.]MCA3584774.1 DUF2232 domain-containing protein [Methylocystis sp.]MCA3589828.1 DUF2232 domain-containing protein [Methylocystis sp.]MCA3593211.1 DUF2232 domain-containing protein [Methylocystis sp.]